MVHIYLSICFANTSMLMMIMPSQHPTNNPPIKAHTSLTSFQGGRGKGVSTPLRDTHSFSKHLGLNKSHRIRQDWIPSTSVSYLKQSLLQFRTAMSHISVGDINMSAIARIKCFMLPSPYAEGLNPCFDFLGVASTP